MTLYYIGLYSSRMCQNNSFHRNGITLNLQTYFRNYIPSKKDRSCHLIDLVTGSFVQNYASNFQTRENAALSVKDI